MLNVSLNNHSRKRDRDNHDFLKNQIMLDMKLFKNVFWDLRNKFLGFPMIDYTIFKNRENGRYSRINFGRTLFRHAFEIVLIILSNHVTTPT